MPIALSALKKSVSLLLLSSFSVFICFPLFAINATTTNSTDNNSYVEGEVIVKFKEEKIDLDNQNIFSAIHLYTIENELDKKKEFKDLNTVVYESDQKTTSQLIEEFKNNPNVEYAEPNFKAWVSADIDTNEPTDPNDTYFDNQFALDNDGQNSGTVGVDINAKPAWDIVEATGSGTQILVGVVDTGIDYTHRDLRENLWYNPDELELADTNGNNDGQVTYSEVIALIGDYNLDNTTDLKDLFVSHVSNVLMNLLDEDGNGYTNDFIGWDVYNNDNNPMDDHTINGSYHGTHVAGIIGASKDNNLGIAGINTEARLVAIKTFDNEGGSNFIKIIDSITYGDSIGVKIMNNSFGSTSLKSFDGASLKNKMEDSGTNNGTLFVVAAGNGNAITLSSTGFDIDSDPTYTIYPASFDLANIISVAATENNDTISSYSNYGQTSIDIAAPGSGIYSTSFNSTYVNKNGTSMATPMVSGSASYLYKYLEYLNGSVPTYLELKNQILDHTEYVTGLNGYLSLNTEGVRGKRLNLYDILPPKVNYEFAPHQTTPGDMILTVTGNKAGTLTIAANPGLVSYTHTVDISGTGSYMVEFTDQARNTYTTDAQLADEDLDWIENLTINDTHSSSITRNNVANFALSGTCFDNNAFNLKITTDGDTPPDNTVTIENISCVSGIWSTILDLSSLENGEVTFKLFNPNDPTITGESETINKNVTSGSSGGGGGGGSTPIKVITTTEGLSDIDESAFVNYINNLYEAGVVSGYSDNTFRPDDPVTREQMAKFIVNAFDLETDTTNITNFPDIDSGSKFITEIATLKALNIVNGYSDGTYKPAYFITRGEVTKFIVLSLQEKGLNIQNSQINTFPDVPQDSVFVIYINYLASQNINNETILGGYSDGRFKPDEYITRGQMCKIIWNSMEYLESLN